MTRFEATNDAPDIDVTISDDRKHHNGLMDALDRWEAERIGRNADESPADPRNVITGLVMADVSPHLDSDSLDAVLEEALASTDRACLTGGETIEDWYGHDVLRGGR